MLEGLRPGQDIEMELRDNDRTQDLGYVGPVMHFTEFSTRYGAEAMPRIPWVVLANPERYAHVLPDVNAAFTRVEFLDSAARRRKIRRLMRTARGGGKDSDKGKFSMLGRSANRSPNMEKKADSVVASSPDEEKKTARKMQP